MKLVCRSQHTWSINQNEVSPRVLSLSTNYRYSRLIFSLLRDLVGGHLLVVEGLDLCNSLRGLTLVQ